jgi:hypothetical protein
MQGYNFGYFNMKTEIYKIVSLSCIWGFENCCVSTVYYGGEWWAVVKTVMNIRVRETAGNCLNSCANYKVKVPRNRPEGPEGA